MSKFVGILYIFISTVFFALIPVLMKKTSVKLPPFTIMAISMFVLFLSSFILSIIFEKSLLLKFTNYKSEFFILFIVGVINTVAFFLAILGYKYMPIWQQSFFTLLVPLLSGLFAFWILQEAISPKLFVGLMIIGLGLVYTLI